MQGQGLIVIVVLLIVFANIVKKAKTKQQTQQQTQQQAPKAGAAPAAAQAVNKQNVKAQPANAQPVKAQPEEGDDPCHDGLYGDRHPFAGIEKNTGFDEGIDPCHDDMPGMLKDETVWEDVHDTANIMPAQDDEKTELLRAMVMAEVLGRPVSQKRSVR